MSETLKELYKVNSHHIFLLWRNFALSLLVLIVMVLITKLLPSVYAPLISTAACGVLYYMVYNSSFSGTDTCTMLPYAIFNVLLAYTTVTVALNILNVWCVISLHSALVFFEGYFIPGLIFAPCGVVVCTLIYIRRHKLAICRDCQLQNGAPIERGRSGIIFSGESELQVKNLILIFSLITIVQWSYFMYEFNDVNITSRDSFIFTWISCSVILGDMLYFAIRYYNLYLDLKENDAIVSPGELQNLSTRTYLRFYLICGDNIFLSKRKVDVLRDITEDIIDTPFMTKQLTKSIPESSVKEIVQRMTGVDNGKLKFFFGRKVTTIGEHKILRYFYFLPGGPADYPQLENKGRWISSERFKTIYNTSPMSMSSTLLSDTSRMATVLVTSKIYNEQGERRNKLMQYKPSFNFTELATKDLNFNDDFWIYVSRFNSDSRFFHLKRWLRRRRKHEDSSFNRPTLL